jgi:hypothetical protein
MKSTKLAGFLAVSLTVFTLGMQAAAADTAAATTTCTDGTTSTATGRGACSGHGGVQKPAAAAPAAAAPAAAPASSAPASSDAPATCKDGTTTTATGRGACSGHGGVQKPPKSKPAAGATAPTVAAAPAAAAAPAPAPAMAMTAAKSSTASKSAPTATAGNTDPTGATAKCKDGTYSKSQHHSGTCSSHGGVAEWLTAQ